MSRFVKALLPITAAAVLVLFAGCAPSQISNPWSGSSIDLLQKDSEVTVTSAGEKDIKVVIKLAGAADTCEGTFSMISSRSGIPLFSGAVKSYKGSFKQASGPCQNAIGSPGNVSQFLDIKDSTMPVLFNPLLLVCNTDSTEMLCLAKNTFKIAEQKPPK